MSCKGCPGTESLSSPLPSAKVEFHPLPRANPPQPAAIPLGYVAYGGGPPIRQLTLIGQTLPQVATAPKFHSDGSIEFAVGQPSEIDGYVRDKDNLLLFRPLWQFCQRRLMGAVQPSPDTLEVVSKCIEPSAPTFNQFVAHHDCAACPFRMGVNGREQTVV